jgi:hypothetical protein
MPKALEVRMNGAAHEGESSPPVATPEAAVELGLSLFRKGRVCAYARMMHVCTSVCVNICICICVCSVCVVECMYVCVNACMCVCINVSIGVYTYGCM